MAISFPLLPSVNQLFTVDSRTWKYDGEKWLLVMTTGTPVWPTTQTVNTQTGTTYQLLSSDLGKLVTLNNSSAVTVTVGTSLGMTAGQSIDLLSLGAGLVTVSAGGATLNGTPGLKLRAQYSAATLYCTASNTYILIGDLSA